MKPRITVLTIGVDDLEKSLKFYRDGLGLQTQGIVGTEFEHGAVVFFDLQNGLKLALYPRKEIAYDAKIALNPPSATEFTIGHTVNSKEEVDEVMRQAEKAGARITKPAGDTFWGGYAGYFQDPNGHLWEIAWNPAWETEQEWIKKLEQEGFREIRICPIPRDAGEHTHDQHTVHVILEGELTIEDQEGTKTFRPGDRVEFPAGTTHKASGTGGSMIVGVKEE